MTSPEKDQQLEYEIQNKGLTAPRLTPSQSDSKIMDIRYHRVERTTTTLWSLVLENGFVVNGESACASLDNFDEAIVRKLAFDNARDKIWLVEGYLLKEKLYQISLGEC